MGCLDDVCRWPWDLYDSSSSDMWCCECCVQVSENTKIAWRRDVYTRWLQGGDVDEMMKEGHLHECPSH